MDYITEILKLPIIQALLVVIIAVIAQKAGLPIAPFIKKYLGINGNGYLKKEDMKEILDVHKNELKTNDFFHLGQDLGEIKEMLKSSKEWQEIHTKMDDERHEQLLDKIKRKK